MDNKRYKFFVRWYYSASIIGTLIVSLTLFIVMLTTSILGAYSGTQYIAVIMSMVVYIAVAGITVFLLLKYVTEQIIVDSQKIVVKNLFGIIRAVEWSSVIDVRVGKCDAFALTFIKSTYIIIIDNTLPLYYGNFVGLNGKESFIKIPYTRSAVSKLKLFWDKAIRNLPKQDKGK